ncbi:DUF1173 family protein [Brucella pituitosa]|uniref:DUF1173 family protein n=1 Tax=Brucella pituitosa TaxID=571256 RepID=UPI0009A1E7BA|nr:DUF1173 family protein [Brucella pituitosa]
MLVNPDRLPCETIDDRSLIEKLTSDSHTFVKGLSFNIRNKPHATASLTDTKPKSAMYILYPDTDHTFHETIQQLAYETRLPAEIGAEQGLPS